MVFGFSKCQRASKRKLILIITKNNEQVLNQLKTQIAIARNNLQTAWALKNMTDPNVLAAGEEFDELLNEYLRLTRK